MLPRANADKSCSVLITSPSPFLTAIFGQQFRKLRQRIYDAPRPMTSLRRMTPQAASAAAALGGKQHDDKEDALYPTASRG
ncbi:MAG: hypothetical protein E5W94_07425 [Mesorhizobium sp.]|nr:MAG: hypothetical protein E5W94_07425 [Mesorhizobium sp.]